LWALRLARHFGTSPDFWMNIQKDYELILTVQKSLRSKSRSGGGTPERKQLYFFVQHRGADGRLLPSACAGRRSPVLLPPSSAAQIWKSYLFFETYV
jgi:hypothetical protein